MCQHAPNTTEYQRKTHLKTQTPPKCHESGLAVFIDGCFWHGCPEHATVPVTNADYWRPKLARNIERDRETNAMGEAEGWRVLRIWEHVPPEEAVRLIVRVLEEGEDPNGSK